MSRKFKLMEVFGIELEYMVVDQKSLNVKPIADQLFKVVTGHVANEVNNPRIDWSNELVLHVVEFKNNKPEPKLNPLISLFQDEVKRANASLQNMGCKLLPTAMHPWMNPETETQLWPHENNEIYRSYDRIFSCKGHGWSNLQSMHINISFDTDAEFRKLHSAIRFILPLVPALSSSSPIYENEIRNDKSSRLRFYLQNQKRIPSIIGDAVPDVIVSEAEYQEKVLQPIYDDIKPFDTYGVLQEEWLNSRGAIPKFERGCIEIRLADLQEAPFVDIAIADFWIKALRMLVNEQWLNHFEIESFATKDLRDILDKSVKEAEKAVITNSKYLSCFGFKQEATTSMLLQELFTKLRYSEEEQDLKKTMEKIFSHGSLSTRILRSLVEQKNSLHSIYEKLSVCLNQGVFFEG